MKDVPSARTTLRRIGAMVAMAGSAVGFAILSTREDDFLSLSLVWAVLAGITGAASLLLLRRRVMSQVLARGVAWLVLLPSGASVLQTLLDGRLPHAGELGFAATSAAALLLARTSLHTAEARREFHPIAYRRIFLAGAVASMTAAMVAGTFAVEALRWGPKLDAVGLAALTLSLAASGLGVVRMRGWGVLLGAVTAAASLLAALIVHDEFATVGLALAALPGAVLTLPLVAARLPLREPAPANATATTLAPDSELALAPAPDSAPALRARVADDVWYERARHVEPVDAQAARAAPVRGARG